MALNESGLGKKIGDFRPISHRIFEMVQDRTKVAVDYQWEVEHALLIGTQINCLDLL